MKIAKKMSAAALSLGLVVGLSGLAGAVSGSIDNTGPDSNNEIKSDVRLSTDVDNHNDLSVRNDNHQDATSGVAVASDSTTAGDATSGDASNGNSFNASVSVTNSASSTAALGADWNNNSTASIDTTGPDSNNEIKYDYNSDVDVTNNNNLNVTNNNSQTATTGDATVTHNTTGGSATTGNASNTNSSSVTFNVSN